LSAVHEFYEFHRERGEGPLVNPVPVAGRRHGHHNPMDDFAPTRRPALRQKEPQPLPRAIPDMSFNELFRKLKSHRDRALAAFYVSSGAPASELLGLTGDMINYGDQLIGVVRKGRGPDSGCRRRRNLSRWNARPPPTAPSCSASPRSTMTDTSGFASDRVRALQMLVHESTVPAPGSASDGVGRYSLKVAADEQVGQREGCSYEPRRRWTSSPTQPDER
jgi:integrase